MVLEAVTAGVVETDLQASTSSQVVAFERWLTGRREASVIDRYVGD
jgi:hypothetical protein